MYRIVRFFLFLFNPEEIHHITFKMIKIAGMIPGKLWTFCLFFKVKDARLEREVFGLKFDNPVGLAAGFDKDAKLFDELASFGFGFVEIGTVTPLPQEGNPKPRLFRLKEDNAIINRMGFNNQGIEAAVARLRRRKTNIIIGGNIGKNKVTPNEKAVDDYEICFEKLFPYVDYFVVNVSSPNTPGLRDLQEKAPLTALLNRLQELNNEKESRKPILLKISTISLLIIDKGWWLPKLFSSTGLDKSSSNFLWTLVLLDFFTLFNFVSAVALKSFIFCPISFFFSLILFNFQI